MEFVVCPHHGCVWESDALAVVAIENTSVGSRGEDAWLLKESALKGDVIGGDVTIDVETTITDAIVRAMLASADNITAKLGTGDEVAVFYDNPGIEMSDIWRNDDITTLDDDDALRNVEGIQIVP